MGAAPGRGRLIASFAVLPINICTRPAALPPCPSARRVVSRPAASIPRSLPLCAAGLAMPLKFTFTDRTSTLVVHERGKYVCPQRPLQTTPAALPPAAPACPVNHERWPAGGCTAMMPISIGARLRYQLDRRTRPTRRSTSSAPPTSAPIARPLNSALAAPAAPPVRHHQPEYPDLRAHQPARPTPAGAKEKLAHQPQMPGVPAG